MARSSMSRTLIDRSPDLKQLEEEGYEVEVRSGHLLLKDIPYVAGDGSIKQRNFGVGTNPGRRCYHEAEDSRGDVHRRYAL